MSKIGRNDPCPCGKLKSDGTSIKYKKCCYLQQTTAQNTKKKLPKLTRKMLIGSPYTECPNCKRKTFGVHLFSHGDSHFDKECTKCGYGLKLQLPEIKKRIVYIDQFVFDNIVKTLDSQHPKHDSVSKDTFWLEVFKKLEVASRAQLIVCPDSFFHKEESSYSNYFPSMKRIYEHFSGGITFYPKDYILKTQIGEHFRNYLEGHPEIEPTTKPEDIVFEKNLHRWSPRMGISVGGAPTPDMIEISKKERKQTHQNLVNVFERWQTEKGKSFEDWYWEETNGFAKGTFLSIIKHAEKQREIADKIAKGEHFEWDLSNMFPPSSQDLVESMTWVAKRFGMTNDEEIMLTIRNYLFSKELDHIPSLRIGTLLFACLAHQASEGRKKPPNEGTATDVDMISSLLPYCDAIFVDKENDSLLSDNRVKSRLRVTTKVFSLKDKQKFLDYLDEVISSMLVEHKSYLESYYGPNWQEPYLSILEDERKKERMEEEYE